MVRKDGLAEDVKDGQGRGPLKEEAGVTLFREGS
jgi:hypothetical protein